jgi:GNAT superfamily N-acetyltransferase
MINAVTIIPYTQMHQQQVIELVLGTQQNEFNIPITLQDQPDLLMVDAFYRKGNGNFWVAIHNEQVVGSIALLDAGQGLATLRKMFVHKAYRGSTYKTAQLLYDHLENFAIANSFTSIMLGTVEKLIAARKFYVKNGFDLIDKAMLPAHFPVMAVDNMFYVKHLNR